MFDQPSDKVKRKAEAAIRVLCYQYRKAPDPVAACVVVAATRLGERFGRYEHMVELDAPDVILRAARDLAQMSYLVYRHFDRELKESREAARGE